MHLLNRRTILGGLGALAVATPFRARASGITPELIEAARKEGGLTWYIAQVDTATAEAMGRAFTDRFPGVTVSVIRTTGQVAYERLLQDLKNNAPQCDVFSSTDVSQYPALKNADRWPTTRRPVRRRCCRRSRTPPIRATCTRQARHRIC
jgi:iron(III) transport system substrate-binding protein